jgi:acetyl esterase/lipase
MRIVTALLAVAGAPFTGFAQRQATQPNAPSPTVADIDYAPPEPATSKGHKLDLYIPVGARTPMPVVIWTAGSAWMSDMGKSRADVIAAQLLPLGYVVAGVSIRSSSQAKFPAQLHDIKAAIRWLRANAAKYQLDPDHIGLIGDSSGGWTTVMAALTGDSPELEGSIGVTQGSSRIQAAIAFYPPTDFLSMDAWAPRKCGSASRGAVGAPNVNAGFCHDDQGSPESRLVGCAIQTCPEKVHAADPTRYITAGDPPVMIFHGDSDPLVPHNQGERLYMALNKACASAVFISLPKAGHGPVTGFLTDDALREAATTRSTSADGCTVTNPVPYRPTWKTVTDFFDKYLRP